MQTTFSDAFFAGALRAKREIVHAINENTFVE